MEVVLCMICGIGAWLGCWLLLGGGEVPAHVWEARWNLVVRIGRTWFDRLAGSALVELLLSGERVARDMEEVRRFAAAKGQTLEGEDAVALLLVALACTSIAGGCLSQSAVGSLVLVVGFMIALHLWAASCRQRRARELAHEMPGVLRTMASALESGNTLAQAIGYVGLHERGLAARPFARTSLRLRCGMSVDAALEGLRSELKAPGVELLVTALSISQRTGSPLRSLLQRSAVLVEQQGEFDRMLTVRTAQVRLSVRIVCCLPLLMICLLALISPDYQQGLSSPPGVACLVLAACLDGVALVLIRRIISGVL